jgi:hypothetical protein
VPIRPAFAGMCPDQFVPPFPIHGSRIPWRTPWPRGWLIQLRWPDGHCSGRLLRTSHNQRPCQCVAFPAGWCQFRVSGLVLSGAVRTVRCIAKPEGEHHGGALTRTAASPISRWQSARLIPAALSGSGIMVPWCLRPVSEPRTQCVTGHLRRCGCSFPPGRGQVAGAVRAAGCLQRDVGEASGARLGRW